MNKAKSTMIIYAIYCNGTCYENMIHSLKAAEKIAEGLLEINGKQSIQIARYDRSERSNYFEIVKQYN